MKTVVLFKSESVDYVEAFHDNNYRTVFVEPLHFEFINKQELSMKLLQDYTGMILTSPRAIEAVSKCWDPTRFILWRQRKVYTVGEASCYKARLLLGLDPLGMSSGNAENLAKIIVQENPSESKFLFPCGNLISESLPTVLQASHVVLDTLTVYKSEENMNLKSDLIKLSKADNLCCLVFFSPSGCEYTYRLLQTIHHRFSQLPHFAIGNTTAQKLQNIGVVVAGVAAKPTALSVVESVQNYFTRVGRSH